MELTYRAVQERLRAAGVVMSKRGETIRINFFGGLEDTARYSNDLEEALANGLEMAGRGNSAPKDLGAD
jgi:hypothetical protein